MERYRKVLKLFIASPSDVLDERRVAREVVQSINTAWSEATGVFIEVVEASTYARPGFGQDAQDVINEQIGTDYEIFVGIMWSRFGTPTKRADSGTEEEFLRAYDRLKTDPSALEVMFYFKNTPIAPDDIDLDQLRSVNRFKDKVNQLGGYYFTFRNTSDFQQHLHLHLSQIIQKHERAGRRKKKPERVELEETPTMHMEIFGDEGEGMEIHISSEPFYEQEDLGFLDYWEIFESNFDRLKEVVAKISDSLVVFTARIGERIDEFVQLLDKGPVSIRQVRPISRRSAKDFLSFQVEIGGQPKAFEESFKSGMDAALKAIDLSSEDLELDAEEIGKAIESTNALVESLSLARKAFLELMDAVGSLPRLSKEFNAARRKTSETISELEVEFAEALEMVRQLEGNLQALKARAGKS